MLHNAWLDTPIILNRMVTALRNVSLTLPTLCSLRGHHTAFARRPTPYKLISDYRQLLLLTPRNLHRVVLPNTSKVVGILGTIWGFGGSAETIVLDRPILLGPYTGTYNEPAVLLFAVIHKRKLSSFLPA